MSRDIVFAVNPEQECLDVLKKFKHRTNLKGARVHFVFIFEVQYYFNELSTYVFPTEEQKEDIKTNFVKILEGVKGDILDDTSAPGEIIHQCLFAYDPKEKMVDYLEQNNADLVVVATRPKGKLESFFGSSFAEHLVEHSPCDVLTIRP